MVDIHWALQTYTAATCEPVSSTQIHDWLRISTSVTADDDVIDALITVARKAVEGYTHRSLLVQTFSFTADAWPSSTAPVKLPVVPLVESTDHLFSITTYDEDGTASVWSTSEYRLDTVSEPGRVMPLDDYEYPTDLRAHDGVLIRFPAGYSSAAASVDEGLVHAVKCYAAYLYEHRGDDLEGSQGLPPTVKLLLEDYVLPDVG